MDISGFAGCGASAAYIGLIGGDLMDSLAAAHHLRGGPGFELRTVRVAPADR
jgi:hypothetical protein